MYQRWKAGEPKSQLEIEYWNNPTSHGKAFTAYTKKWLGVATETKSAQSDLVERLESRLRANGISPTDAGDLEEEYRLLAKARESALEAVRVYNEPSASYLACMRTPYLGFLPHIEAHNCGSLKSTY
jgi:hypothetical protein